MRTMKNRWRVSLTLVNMMILLQPSPSIPLVILLLREVMIIGKTKLGHASIK